MALMTMIGRVADGLPLVGTMQEDEQVKKACLQIDPVLIYRSFGLVTGKLATKRFPNGFNRCFFFQTGKSVLEYQNQAKLLFRKLTPASPKRCSIETGPYLFQ